MKVNKLIVYFLVYILLLYTNHLTAEAKNNKIEDNSNIFKNIKEIENVINDFENKHNIEIFIYTLDSIGNKNTYEEANLFTEKRFNNDNYILYYITKEEGNVALLAGRETQSIVTNEMFSLMLTSMEADFKEFKYDKGIKTSLINLDALISQNNRLEEENKSNHKVLNIDNQKEENRTIYIAVMIISILITFVCISLFIKGSNNKKEAN